MIKNFSKLFFSKTVLAVVLPLLCMAAAVPAFAQSAEIRSAGVYYWDTGTNPNINDVYCNWDADDLQGQSAEDVYKGGIVNVAGHQTSDPWDTSALIEYDQPFPSPKVKNKYPNHCLALCMDVYCTNKPNGAATYSIAFPLQRIRFEIVKYFGSKDILNPDSNPAVRTIQQSTMQNYIVDGTGTTPTTDTNLSKYMCAAYTCLGSAADWEDTSTCPNPEYECKCSTYSYGCCRSLNNPTAGYTLGASVCGNVNADGTFIKGKETKCLLRSGAASSGRGYNDPIRFCTSWDGSWEILGEFGKTNGQYGFRANVHTDYPGDGIVVENISIDDNFVYPGNNQFPIQVDVTNVHTVRTTPTVVGALNAVQAAPYTFVYRLSKDANVKILVYDASTNACTTWGTQTTEAACVGASGTWMYNYNTDTTKCCTKPKPLKIVRDLVDWQPRLGEGFKGSESDGLIQESDSWDGRDDEGRLLPAGNYLVSIQAKTDDEWPGTDFSRAVTRQVSLDPLKLTDIATMALNKQSTAYAQINYVPTEASRVYLEVYSPGTTFDSLYTDSSVATGISPTVSDDASMERVYHAEQERARGLNYAERWDGLCHAVNNSGEPVDCIISYPVGTKMPFSGKTLVDSGAFVNDTCDGLWNNTAKLCRVPFENGAPLPDGDYVYALWAEIPYVDSYTNAAGDKFTGVKTQRYYTGLLSIDRGVADIVVQPTSYSTVGSSPAAYGLDPFIFKYTTSREAVVNAYVKNTAGLTVKTLTTGDGTHNTSVAQQMNTLTWDGRDDLGRMVGPGTYMFVVEAKDAMFPNSVKTQASTIFPVDLYRITDLTTTDVYGDTAAKATISYMLSKPMNVQINIYNKDVVIPVVPGAKTEPTTTSQNTFTIVAADTEALKRLPGVTAGTAKNINQDITGNLTDETTSDEVGSTYYVYTKPTVAAGEYTYYRLLKYVSAVTATTETYQIKEVIKYVYTPTDWPPRVCDKTTDAAHFSGGYVDPATEPQCIYVNDTNFTNYPANANAAQYNYAEGAKQTLDVRLQPVKTFNKSALNTGDGIPLTEEWDAQYFYNPTPISIADGGKNTLDAIANCKGQNDLKNCPYEMVPDGTYPFYVAAQTNEPVDLYYDTTDATPLRDAAVAQTGLYATDKWVHRLNITRGPVYFLDGSVDVYANAPQLFNTSSGPIFVPPYEINFAISRAATVEIAIIGLKEGMCTTSKEVGAPYGWLDYDSQPGQVCKYLSTMTIVNTPNFDPNIVRRVYWDGTDNNGKYVKNGNYEIRLTAKNYPDETLYQPTVKQITRNIDLVKVFDLPDAEAYAINKRGTDMNVSYQISVPMKVALQIFRPGTTIYDYQKGTLRDPSTGMEVTNNIRDVLVKAIVGIRPSTTLIEELWDGTDYAQQEVADGTYPFRFVTALDGADIDSVTGEIVGEYVNTDGSTNPADWKINRVADTQQYVNLHHATVAIGDGEFVCEDWEKTVFFYPNPFTTEVGTLEVTKIPVPGTMSVKMFNLAGDLVREGGYTCVDAQGMAVNMGTSLDIKPDNILPGSEPYETMAEGVLGQNPVRNAALRCFWDRKNDHGKKVARGVYFGLVDFRASNGRQHCQKVVRILISK